jgi:hypothetical protein
MKDNSKLFEVTPEFEKVSYKRVGDNPSDWTADVMESFYNQFPFFVNSKIALNFTQKDESRGYAIGQITVEEGPGLTIPIIIKDKELYPFDVAIAGGNTMPLTNSTIQMYIENKGAFWKLVSPDAGDTTNALFNTSFSQSITPTYMHETYKQAEFDAESMSEKLMRTSLHQKLVNTVSQNPHPEDKQLSGVLNSKEVLPEDIAVKRLQDETTMGGQMKANQVYAQLKKDYDMMRGDSILYTLLAYKKWCQDNGIKTHSWNILGEGTKLAGSLSDIASWFFPEDVNFLSQKLDMSHARIHSIKKHEPEKFERMYGNVRAAVEKGQDPKALLLGGEGDLVSPLPSVAPTVTADRTQAEVGLNQPKGPSEGVTWSTKKGELHKEANCTPEEKLEKHVELVKSQGPELKTNYKEEYSVDEFISKIAPTISGPMKVAFFDVLQKDASIVEGFKKNKSVNLILKVAGLNPQEINFQDKVRQELDRNIHYIYKSGSHEYTGIFGNSVVSDPFRVTLTDLQAKAFEPIKVAEFTPAKGMEKTGSIKYAFAVRDRKYVVLDNNDFVEFEPGMAAPIEDDGHFKFAAENIVAASPHVTKYATWITNLGFMNPFETLRVWESDGKEFVETWTGIEKKAYCRMKGIDEPYEEKGITYLPENAQFVKLGNRVEIPERFINDLIDHKLVKTAHNQYHSNFGEVTRNGGDADLHGTVWNMIQAGARKSDIEKVGTMKEHDVLHIHYDLKEPHTIEKIAELMAKSYDKDADVIVDVAKNFIKEAATFNDSPTVDSILSLNFVNKNNIIEFVDALPLFAQTSQKLADMLLKARLGVSLIDEGAIRRVMLGIVDIMDVLNGVQNLVEKK